MSDDRNLAPKDIQPVLRLLDLYVWMKAASIGSGRTVYDWVLHDDPRSIVNRTHVQWRSSEHNGGDEALWRIQIARFIQQRQEKRSGSEITGL